MRDVYMVLDDRLSVNMRREAELVNHEKRIEDER
jgi:hypothetical protein